MKVGESLFAKILTQGDEDIRYWFSVKITIIVYRVIRSLKSKNCDDKNRSKKGL